MNIDSQEWQSWLQCNFFRDLIDLRVLMNELCHVLRLHFMMKGLSSYRIQDRCWKRPIYVQVSAGRSTIWPAHRRPCRRLPNNFSPAPKCTKNSTNFDTSGSSLPRPTPRPVSSWKARQDPTVWLNRKPQSSVQVARHCERSRARRRPKKETESTDPIKKTFHCNTTAFHSLHVRTPCVKNLTFSNLMDTTRQNRNI